VIASSKIWLGYSRVLINRMFNTELELRAVLSALAMRSFPPTLDIAYNKRKTVDDLLRYAL